MMEELDKLKKELGLTLSREGKFRIVLFFMGEFSASKTNRGVITLFLSGTELTTDMDYKVYECPNRHCTGVLLPHDYQRANGGPAICPKCHRTHKQTDLVGEMIYDATVDKWSAHLARYVRALNMDCDIDLQRLKTHQSLIAADMVARNETSTRAKKLLKTARQKEEAIYRMSSMIKDTKNGQSLEKAIKGFLLA